MLGVEHHDAELLDRPRSVLRQEKRGELTRGRQTGSVGTATYQGAPPELDGGENLRGASGADTRNLTQVSGKTPGQPVQSTRLGEQTIGEAVQRAEEGGGDAEAAGAPTPDTSEPATATAVPAPPGAPPAAAKPGGADLDELARRLYAPMSALLRAELSLGAL